MVGDLGPSGFLGCTCANKVHSKQSQRTGRDAVHTMFVFSRIKINLNPVLSHLTSWHILQVSQWRFKIIRGVPLKLPQLCHWHISVSEGKHMWKVTHFNRKSLWSLLILTHFMPLSFHLLFPLSCSFHETQTRRGRDAWDGWERERKEGQREAMEINQGF